MKPAFSLTPLVLLACLAGSAGADEVPWPDRDWERQDAAEAGFDVGGLEAALDLAGETNAKAVVVVHGGKIVAERYWDGWDARTTGPLHSATKSVVAVLVGIAIEEGLIEGLDQPSADFLEEWQGTLHAEITIRHHLSMTTGLQLGDPGRMILRGALARDARAHAAGLAQVHEPGEAWGYHNPAYKLLFPILEEASGASLDDFASERLFEPLGIRSATFARKRFGNQDVKSLTCSAPDLARFGLLVLRGGRWAERQIVPAAFLQEATTPSQTLNPSYGFLFWLNAGTSHRLPTTRTTEPVVAGRLFPDCPPDTVAALGANDQKCYIVPSRDLVVVRLGDAAARKGFAASRFDNPFLSQICAAAPQR